MMTFAFIMASAENASNREHTEKTPHNSAKKPCRTCVDFKSWMQMQGKAFKDKEKVCQGLFSCCIEINHERWWAIIRYYSTDSE